MTPKNVTDFTTAALALIVISTMSIIALLGKNIPDIMVGTVGTIVGVYFGRVSNNIHTPADQSVIIAAASAAASKAAIDAMLAAEKRK